MDLIKWITEQQAAELIDRSPRTLRKWRTRGEVTAYRQAGIRGLVLYDTHSLRECAATQAMRLHENVGRPPS
ncbi:hypothetical protein O1W68_07690 [Rhodococcus sp. H36-A4]|uniref:helix-turn-helix domain-containing protein n=1 Tax=Rhodococcus sp. H36-A4 TaxID=3004353 RepID=UPI0022AF709A|nr:helix-turn-helix domain-containing protein [Rhodococcus sp. H36-A4]MCZ4077817.1 hypothetical protein [Rhodococcus sp. H36-A4]